MEKKGKKYYRIGDVSRLTGVDAHVLRYWEGEFRQIRPHRVARQRLYRPEDIELIGRIKELLYEKGFTIAGAKKQLSEEGRAVPVQAELFSHDCGKMKYETVISEIRAGLVLIRQMLEG
ncbi:MAG: MerR family transcriptional regulator [Dissulfurimicrobium sp.]|uniref:MerR family transcriptional regulator n=1 Tax=Dissulfurimicrobium TaxID=1769732 RepID=UPI001EDAE0BB|nr:MerR family transcriptional regulator [Dissulfurimicrobium hydrothermale]UKL13793.1 MerR family transcriptional regulator [Dissulfurimicrobium hydrothermale]